MDKRKTSVWIEEDVLDWIEDYADRVGVASSEVIRAALRSFKRSNESNEISDDQAAKLRSLRVEFVELGMDKAVAEIDAYAESHGVVIK